MTEPASPDDSAAVDAAGRLEPGATSGPPWRLVSVALVIAVVAWTIAYLAVAVPGQWFNRAPTLEFVGAQMKLTRGVGVAEGAQFIVRSPDPSGIVVVTVPTPALDASQYRRIRWRIQSIDPEATLLMAWRSTTDPTATATSELEDYGDSRYGARLQPPKWSGRIEGIALTVRGPMRQPLIVEGVSIDGMDAADIVADRLDEWFAFRNWNGLSINSAIGGPLEQKLWLPLCAVVVALTAIAIVLARARKRTSRANLRIAVVAIVLLAWLSLDARWLWLRMQQTGATADAFAGKDPRDKHMSDVDGYLYAFAEQVIARLPKSPQRIYVAADDQYFGGRMAYHLYPHNAYMNRAYGGLPTPDRVKPGEYIVVFRRRNVQYDPANRLLSWDQYPPIHAEVLIAHQGNAAFRVLGPS